MNVTLWPGKHLSQAEEEWLRRRILSLTRDGSAASRREAERLRRYLPEHAAGWTPDELEGGAHIGPWVDVTAEVEW